MLWQYAYPESRYLLVILILSCASSIGAVKLHWLDKFLLHVYMVSNQNIAFLVPDSCWRTERNGISADITDDTFENVQKGLLFYLFLNKLYIFWQCTYNVYCIYMIYGELGWYLVEIRVKLRIVLFWTKLVQSENKLSSILYRLMLHFHQSGKHDFKLISCIMSIFDNAGPSYIFANQLNINIHSLKPVLKERLHDQFIQQWFTDVETSSCIVPIVIQWCSFCHVFFYIFVYVIWPHVTQFYVSECICNMTSCYTVLCVWVYM